MDDLAHPLPEARDRPATIAHVLEYGLARTLFFFFRMIGLDGASALAGGFTRIVGSLSPFSKRADDNLRAVYPEMSARNRRRIIAGVWENLGRTVGEMAHLDRFRPGEPDGRVEVVIPEGLTQSTPGALPGIFVSGHFANWELMAIALHRTRVNAAFVYRALNNPLLDGYVIRTRGPLMGRLIPKGRHGARPLVDALHERISLGMLVDQKLNGGIRVPFMGLDAMTTPAAARLSLKLGRPIYPARIERLSGAHFRITVERAIDYAPTGDFATDVRNLTILVNERIGSYVHARPEQWLWLHRRWPKDVVARATVRE